MGSRVQPAASPVLEDPIDHRGRIGRTLVAGHHMRAAERTEIGIESIRLEKGEIRVWSIRAAEHHDPAVVVKRHPVRAVHEPLIGERRLAEPGFDHDHADAILVQERLPFLDVVLAQGLACVFPLQQQFLGKETGPTVDVRLAARAHPSRLTRLPGQATC